MTVKRIPITETVLLLLVLLILSHNGTSALNIYSALPDHIVEWLKRHILIEISNVDGNIPHDYLKDDHLEYAQTCNSINGPFCKYLNQISDSSEFDLDTKKYIYDHEGGIGYFNKDFFIGKSIFNLFLIPKIADLNGGYVYDSKIKGISRTRSDDTTKIQKHCKLTRKSLFYCIKIIILSYYKSSIQQFTGISYISKFINIWKEFLSLIKNKKLFKLINRKASKRASKMMYEKKTQIYTIIDNYNLPPLHSDFLNQGDKFLKTSRIKDDQSQLKYISEFHSKSTYFQTKSNLLFDESLSQFLKSRYVRVNFINSLTWILQQNNPYSDIWQNWRNEKLGKHYIIIDHHENYNCDKFSISPFNGAKICSNLLFGDFYDQFRVIRKAWNGVSSIMNFSILKPNVHILPRQFSSDENLSCNWEGLWETYYDQVLNIKLLSKLGKLKIINEKIVISRLPISISKGFIKSQTHNKMDELKTITISGYNHSKLLWKATIPINEFITEDSNEIKWINALDYSDNIPYSLINIIQFETDLTIDNIEQSIIVGQFEYNLLNPIFNYVPRTGEIYENLNVEIGQVAELSLVVYTNNKEKRRNNRIPSISMTTMYASKASPLVSMYNIEKNRLQLKDRINENTLCVIKRNMAEITKDQ
ncbi:hypothetical protein [Cryptosporidium parvum Iowa II]|uniref:Uncharacterized protein n=2 Tax=Cryptosporidium parvum TaxID=5807 RepID=Q5CWR9_CRYPI|nr:hypothetical protein [Cryptosporidium parvum Iowa II]QOY41287.1 Uncharacterized protein CPATCC_0015610 [Cryptosporidium parvum]WKS78515.1 putative signal peptide-containing protein [Cryptosporidium sp. 43IA8]EAK90005.1 hypothetical protein cgd6_4000 [Cryptosporidium parvum Iowa II]WRK33007.1 Uncharacterized protein cpbgf_6004000 [Cryptosporidium parvum]CAD98441.1 hypothetical predicted transmembrane protein, unknown function [Cryptosporidium parvum]|eukprot:QOY41287.1 hypothetical protein CPATCC_002968 [Cryptosporidium parvum]